jgi:ABC-type Fe3+-hydroxamate transport system substrate-binding protein
MRKLCCTGCVGEITIVDSAGREVVIPHPVNKVVLLTADNCELAVVLGALDKVVGVEKSAPGYAEIGEMFGKAANAGAARSQTLRDCRFESRCGLGV